MSKDIEILRVRPHELLCTLCRATGAEGDRHPQSNRLDEIEVKVRSAPARPVQLVCEVDESPYRYQSTDAERVDAHRIGGELFARKQNLNILQRLGLTPGDVRPAIELFERLLESIDSTREICVGVPDAGDAWRGCPHALHGNYERTRAEGVAAVIPRRDVDEKLRFKRESVAHMYAADHLRIRPHHLLCVACFHAGRDELGPIEEDNLFEVIDIVQKNPHIPIEMVPGCCMICPPCTGYDPEQHLCIGGHGRALRDEMRDLDVLAKLGLEYGDKVPAAELFSRLFAAIPSTRDICGYGDGVERSREWSVCGSPEGEEKYARGRAAGLGVQEIRVE